MIAVFILPRFTLCTPPSPPLTSPSPLLTPHTCTLSHRALGVSGCSQLSGTTCPSCTQLNQDNLLTEAQRGICQNDDATVKAVSRGARKAIIDCQAQFNNLKWNCSTFYGENLFGSFVNQGMEPCGSPAADSADFVIT